MAQTLETRLVHFLPDQFSVQTVVGFKVNSEHGGLLRDAIRQRQYRREHPLIGKLIRIVDGNILNLDPDRIRHIS
jgi:hypothetical protein